MGNRLVKFLSVVLPTHSDYFSIDANLAALRNRSQAQLVELLQYMEELAMLIDEIEYSKCCNFMYSRCMQDTLSIKVEMPCLHSLAPLLETLTLAALLFLLPCSPF